MLDDSGIQSRLLARLLEASALRARVISANIANQNTPGYTRQVVQFEDLLREAVGRGDVGLIDGLRPEVVEDRRTPARPDGNNVAMELELNSLRENRILYETYSTIIAGHFEMLRAAVEESR